MQAVPSYGAPQYGSYGAPQQSAIYADGQASWNFEYGSKPQDPKVSAALSFSLHYFQPEWMYAVVGLGLLLVMAFAYAVFESRRISHCTSGATRAPSWICFLFLTTLAAWIAACAVGTWNYRMYTKPYYDLQHLGTYTDINPSTMRGAQIMDAGMVHFVNGSYLDVSKSAGFKNFEMYCVAPIAVGNAAVSYDFWAVGKGCCSGTQADFTCAHTTARGGGLRLVQPEDRPYYTLAVQQAIAIHKINVAHPLFFTWELDVEATVQAWYESAFSLFEIWVITHAIAQVFVVAIAVVAYTKLGKW